MIIPLNLKENSYNIYLERGALENAGEYLNLNRKALIVTDDGVPPRYSETVAEFCENPVIVTLPAGESTKSEKYYFELLKKLTEERFSRKDCVVAVGGGVMGDLAGFAAATYMRGIDFYNVPTTVLSQVDSSIGGKVAIDFCGYKNIVGAFHQPRAVIIDPNVLSTLDNRQISNGLAESVKMALNFDKELFDIFVKGNAAEKIDTVIEKSLRIKKAVVEKDEKEAGLRKVLNFGHTIAHAVESEGKLLHGECVALGMLPMCAQPLREQLKTVLESLNLPTDCKTDKSVILNGILHDKKIGKSTVSAILCENAGSYTVKELSPEKIVEKYCEVFAN